MEKCWGGQYGEARVEDVEASVVFMESNEESREMSLERGPKSGRMLAKCRESSQQRRDRKYARKIKADVRAD
jgi:hypothetical protein